VTIHTQGFKYLGTGFDDASSDQPVEQLTSYQIAVWPPPKTLNPIGNFTLTKDCLEENQLYATCEGVSTTQPLCGQQSAGPGLTLVALQAKWEGTSGDPRYGFKFRSRSAGQFDVTFACFPDIDIPTEWDNAGAVGKCIAWGFEPTTGRSRRFEACVRALRADYCGDGKSYTKEKTPIDLYDNPNYATSVLQAKPTVLCFEAAWGAKGAICVHKGRYTTSRPSCMKDANFEPPGVDLMCQSKKAERRKATLWNDSNCLYP
jgi:hypothetical protein